MGLAREASSRVPEGAGSSMDTGGPPTRSPTVSSGSRHTDPSPRPHPGSSNRSRLTSPSSQSGSLKRNLSPVPDELDNNNNKRTRMDGLKRRVTPPAGRRSPLPSTRPSPIPFRTQPTPHSPETRQALELYAPSSPHHHPTSLPPHPVLPPHPRPIGAAGLASHGSVGSVPIALPPIATLSPTSTAPSPVTGGMEREDRMQSSVASRSSSPPVPPSKAKLSEIVRPGAPGSPTAVKHTPSPPNSRDKMDTS